MEYYYSPTTRGFYALEIHGAAIPEDAVAVTADEYRALMDSQAAGQVIQPGADGRPEAVDYVPTAADRRAQILAELTALDAAGARPLRAVLAAQVAGSTPAPEDVARLADLETQAQALRAELAALPE